MNTKKQIILERIEQGDSRSYNEIAADLELQIWKERSLPGWPIRNSRIKNNRKRTNGRKIQVIGNKQIKTPA